MTNLERLLQLTSEELDFCSEVDQKFLAGKLAGLKLAQACRLTDAESAVIEASLAMTGERSPRLAMALSCLRTERGLTGEATARQVVADGAPRSRLPECDDCGGMHSTDSVYCPVRQRDDCDD